MAKYNARLDKEKDYKFFINLYPKSDTYNCTELINDLTESCVHYAYILHDKDIADEETGELKKEHIHFYARIPVKRSRKAMSEDFGIPLNHIEYALSTENCIRYLIHLDNPEKTPYPRSEIIGNFDFTKYLCDNNSKENEQLEELYKFLQDNPGASFNTLLGFALQNNLGSCLRKSAYLFKVVMNECGEKK